jgi:hypothetical protein
MLTIAIDKPIVVPERHSLQTVTHRNSPNAVVRLNSVFVLISPIQVPLGHHSSLIPEYNRALVGSESSAVDRFVIFVLLNQVFVTLVKNSETAVLASSIYYLLFLGKATNSSNISFKNVVDRTNGVFRFVNIYYLDTIVHAHYNLILPLCYLNAVWSRCQLDGLIGIAVSRRRIPKTDGVIVRTTGQLQRHYATLPVYNKSFSQIII